MDTRDLVRQMMLNIVSGETAEAQERFEDIVSVKVTDALEAQKQAVAGSIYSTAEEE